MSSARTVKASQALTALFLLLSIIFSLLPPVSPTITHSSIFVIQPISNGRVRNDSSLHTGGPVFLGDGQDGVGLVGERQVWVNDGQRDGGAGDVFGRDEQADLGSAGVGLKSGPAIWVGLLQICSKPSENETIECTSAAVASRHAKYLPPSLSQSLSILSGTPMAPRLFIVSILSTLLATGVLGWTLPIRRRFTARVGMLFKSKVKKRKAFEVDGDSGVKDAHRPFAPLHEDDNGIGDQEKGTEEVPHIGFAIIAGLSVGLTSSAIGTELFFAEGSKRAWNDAVGKEVGLEWRYSAMAFLMICLPFTLLFAIIVAYIPRYSQLWRKRSDQFVSTGVKDSAEDRDDKAEESSVGRPKIVESEVSEIMGDLKEKKQEEKPGWTEDDRRGSRSSAGMAL